MIYEPEERGHRRGRCARCGYRGWSDDTGECPNGCAERGLEIADQLVLAVLNRLINAPLPRSREADAEEEDAP